MVVIITFCFVLQTLTFKNKKTDFPIFTPIFGPLMGVKHCTGFDQESSIVTSIHYEDNTKWATIEESKIYLDEILNQILVGG